MTISQTVSYRTLNAKYSWPLFHSILRAMFEICLKLVGRCLLCLSFPLQNGGEMNVSQVFRGPFYHFWHITGGVRWHRSDNSRVYHKRSFGRLRVNNSIVSEPLPLNNLRGTELFFSCGIITSTSPPPGPRLVFLTPLFVNVTLKANTMSRSSCPCLSLYCWTTTFHLPRIVGYMQKHGYPYHSST